MPALSEDEFRLLAFLRGYADCCEQHLDPNWIQEQLEFPTARMQEAARSLEKRGLVEFFEWTPRKVDLLLHPDIGEGPFMSDICVTPQGWDYLRRPDV